MIRRFLRLFGYALVSNSDAEILTAIKKFDVSVIHRLPVADGALFVVLGLRQETDGEFLKAVGIKEGQP